MPVNLNGMDPRVLAALKKIQADAAARGIQTNVISGVRSLDDQKQLYANWMAGQNHQPLPFPSRGAVPLAAVPGTSEHEKGFAFDLQATDPSKQAELWSLAPAVGLKTIGSSDPNHFELTGGPSRPVSPTPGASYNSPLDLVARLESGNANVPQKIHDINTDRGTPAQGYFQIIDPTWKTYAKAAGVDLNRYPSAITAPRDVQVAVASAIPINQWGPNTVAALRKQYPDLDTSQTLGALQSKAGGGETSVATGAGGDDWQSLLGVPNDPGDISLGSMMSDAVAPSASRAPAASSMPIDDSEPQIDQSFALASPSVQELGARYEQGKATRKLSPLGQLFSLPTIGPQQVKPASGPPPYTNLGVG